jgi:hypothetical protein
MHICERLNNDTMIGSYRYQEINTMTNKTPVEASETLVDQIAKELGISVELLEERLEMVGTDLEASCSANGVACG